MSHAAKPELVLQHLDEWMVRWKHFQTEADWKIELDAQKRRQRNYGLTIGAFTATYLYTMAPSTVNRYFGAPHFFDIGVDVAIKDFLRTTINSQRRWTPNGYARIAANFTVPFLTISFLEHSSEKKRLGQYLQIESVFGEQARRLVKNGKIEEFLAPNVNATA